MTFRTFALILVAASLPAFGTSAMEHKHHARVEDRMMAAHSDWQYRDHQPSWTNSTSDRPDPLTSANGS